MDSSKVAILIWWLANFAVFLVLSGLVWLMVEGFGQWGILISAVFLTVCSGLRERDPLERLEEADE